MNVNIVSKNDEMVMALVHYFITEENYTPIMVKGVQDEVWLEKLDGPYRIIRINSNPIINEEQYRFDIFKTEKIMAQIKRKTLSWKLNTLNIMLNVSDSVKFNDNSKYISSIKIDNIDELTNNKYISEIFPKIKNKVIKDKEGIDLIINVTNDINQKSRAEGESYTKIFQPKKPIMTMAFIAICIVMFILTYVLGNGSEDTFTLVRFGANARDLVQIGQVWRLATSIFLHAGIIHLICNMYALYVVGRQLESFLGKFKYSVVFLGSGIIGSLLSCVIHDTVSVGASGAIFGLLGSLLYFGYHYRLYLETVLKTQIIPIIILNLIIGFTLPGIDNFAHIGGLVGGYLLTMMLGVPGKTKKADQINGAIVLVLLIAFLSFVLMRYV